MQQFFYKFIFFIFIYERERERESPRERERGRGRGGRKTGDLASSSELLLGGGCEVALDLLYSVLPVTNSGNTANIASGHRARE